MKLTTRALVEARLPKAFWTLSSNTFPDQAALSACTGYVRTFETQSGGGLYLHGLPQSGKTFLLVLILRSLVARGYSVLYLTLFELGLLYLDRFTEVPGLTLGQLQRLDLVAIDDLVEDPTKQERNALRQATQRIQHKRPLLLAGTCTLRQLTIGGVDAPTVGRLRNHLVEVPCTFDTSFEHAAKLEQQKARLYA